MDFKRKKVIELHLAGMAQCDIRRELSDLGVNKMFVFRTVKRYRQTSCIGNVNTKTVQLSENLVKREPMESSNDQTQANGKGISPHMNEEQKNHLVNFFAERHSVLLRKTTDGGPAPRYHMKQRDWQNLATALNTMGPPRSTTSWSFCWRAWKTKMKVKFSKETPRTPIAEKMMSLINTQEMWMKKKSQQPAKRRRQIDDDSDDDGDYSIDGSTASEKKPLRSSTRTPRAVNLAKNTTNQPKLAARANATDDLMENDLFECGIIDGEVISADSIEFVNDSDLLKECKTEPGLDPLYVTNAARLATVPRPAQNAETSSGDRERNELLREQNALLRQMFGRAEAHRREMSAHCRGIEEHNRGIEAHNRNLEAHNRAIEMHNRIMRDLKRQKLEILQGKQAATRD